MSTPSRPPLDADVLAARLRSDPQAAFAEVRDAALHGQVGAQLLLAQMYMDGKGTARDPQAALAWYRRAAEAGDFRGQANYASIVLQQGRIDEALHWLRLALAHGSPAFMAHIVPQLAASPHPRVRALVEHPAD